MTEGTEKVKCSEAKRDTRLIMNGERRKKEIRGEMKLNERERERERGRERKRMTEEGLLDE